MDNEQMTIRKALDIATAGAYLIPEIVDGGIRDYVAKEPVLYNVFPKVPWATNTYFIRKRTAYPTAAWGTDGGALPSATNATYDKKSMAIKYLYTRGEVTGPMQRAAGSLFNALALEVEAHSRTMVETLSTYIALGDNNPTSEIEGLVHQIGTDTVLQAGSGNDGGVLDLSAALTLNGIDQGIDNSRGEVDLIVTSRKVRRKIATLLQATQSFVNTTEAAAGFRVMSYDGIPIVTDLHWETATDMFLVRRSDVKVLVHQDFTYEELAKTKDSVDFFIKWYGGLAVEGRPTHLKFTDVGTV